MNWRRGFLRVWVVLTALWLIGATIWMALQGNQTHQQLVSLRCESLLMRDDDAWAKCYDRARGPTAGDTWFFSYMRSGDGWLVLGVPPIILFVLGGIALKTVGWMSKGFRGNT